MTYKNWRCGCRFSIYDPKGCLEKHIESLTGKNHKIALLKIDSVLNDENTTVSTTKLKKLKAGKPHDMWEFLIDIRDINFRYYSYKTKNKFAVLKIVKKKKNEGPSSEEVLRLNEIGKELRGDLE